MAWPFRKKVVNPWAGYVPDPLPRSTTKTEILDVPRIEKPSSDHVPLVCNDRRIQDLIEIGNHQIGMMSTSDLIAINGMLTTASYALNDHLRGNGRAKHQISETLEWASGYADIDSLRDEMDEALSINLDLGEEFLLYRGISLNAESTFDPIGITNGGVTSSFIDPGFAFATPTLEDAQVYRHTDYRDGDIVILMEMSVHSGLFLPDSAYRSPEIHERTSGFRFLGTSSHQVVFPRNSFWIIDSVEKIDSGFLVRVTQGPDS